jgi:anti-sigma regulatory factor (Ser/Thr protein kinase)
MIVRQQVAKATVTSLTYPGVPESVPTVRRLVRAILAHSPRVDDMELIAAELVTNAIRHTPSGREGGTFTITVRQGPGRARLEVADLGTARWRPARFNGDGMAEHGRGLEIVAALADGVGYGVSNGRNICSWATLSWLTSAPPAASQVGSPSGRRATLLRAGQHPRPVVQDAERPPTSAVVAPASAR